MKQLEKVQDSNKELQQKYSEEVYGQIELRRQRDDSVRRLNQILAQNT